MDESAPKVTITYCTQCNWLLRASWMAGELLQTFATEVGEVALRPGTGGIFSIAATGSGAAAAPADRRIDDGTALVWDRKTDGGFPDIVDLKRRVRDVIAPDLVLGHADRAATKAEQDS
ncbi:MAG: SelT/SelW/SelH family protein [Solirubrobacteraceae bacterium]|nr:SelT/SelW/SelH family protein [Solirubrobacteraceae bacterium]